MPDTAAQQLKRILAVIPQFADDKDYPIAAVALAAGTTPKQMVHDFQSITQRFDVAGFVDCVQIHVEHETVSMFTNEFFRPMRLTMSELCALELGLTMLRAERTPADYAAIDGAITRLRKAITTLPANDRHESLRHATLTDLANGEHLQVIRTAVNEQQAVRLQYRSSGATESKSRDVRPYALVYAEHMWYVVSLGDDNVMRHYRLDRIEQVELLDEHFEKDHAVAERVLQAGRAFASDTTRRMTVRYSPRISRWVAEREGTALASDGSLTLEHPVADDSWAVRHVLQYGPEAEVLAPDEIRQLVAARLEAMASA
ncbi:MAG: WYL domain-containing protein [Gemmatimonadaceae bacterium]|nr:WYL domain-containing protein [Gemmatimonadaceae bacterium]